MNSSVLWYATRATGIVALLLLTCSMVLGILTANRFSRPSWPAFAQQDLHKRVALISLVFLALHVLTSVADTYVHIGWASLVVPFTSHYGNLWVALGTISVDLTLAVIVSSLLRHRINPTLWRALHWLTYLSWPVALAHAFGMGTDMGEPWAIALSAGCIAAVLVALVTRVTLHLSGGRRALQLSGNPTVMKHLSTKQAKLT
jgi:methionine sulfoxide reductase heme-binding subunit